MAVYGLLENHLGLRFLAPGVEHIPTRGTLNLPEVDETIIPSFEYRSTLWNAFMGSDMAAKRGFNGMHNKLESYQGGSILYHGFVHTLNMYLNGDEFFDTHPEYFRPQQWGEKARPLFPAVPDQPRTYLTSFCPG